MKNNRKKRVVMLWIVVALVSVIAVGILLARRWVSSSHDYRQLGWLEAFEQVHAHLSRSYPFTAHKDIDWDEMYAQTASRIAQAEADGDLEAYYLAWREYAHAIPDGHVELGGEDFGLREQAIGGGYGLGIIGLDDGRVIVHVLLDDGPAARAGILWGAQITVWDEQPIMDAIAKTSILWAGTTPATSEGFLLEQYRYLVRDPVGTKVTLSFQNPGADEIQTVDLIAENDQLEAMNRTSISEPKELADILQPGIHSETLTSGYGYIDILSFMPTLGGTRPARIFDRAMGDFVEADVPGIIIDVRGNSGGLDALVPEMMGHFVTEPDFYEYVGMYDADTGDFEIQHDQTLETEPREPYYKGRLIILVDKNTTSTAEGIPLVAQRIAQAQVMGLYGTHGSFAVGDLVSGLYRLPEGLAFSYYGGAALNADYEILVDANAEGIGGVMPDVRVPLTEETVYAMFVEDRDVVLEAAIAELDTP